MRCKGCGRKETTTGHCAARARWLRTLTEEARGGPIRQERSDQCVCISGIPARYVSEGCPNADWPVWRPYSERNAGSSASPRPLFHAAGVLIPARPSFERRTLTSNTAPRMYRRRVCRAPKFRHESIICEGTEFYLNSDLKPQGAD